MNDHSMYDEMEGGVPASLPKEVTTMASTPMEPPKTARKAPKSVNNVPVLLVKENPDTGSYEVVGEFENKQSFDESLKKGNCNENDETPLSNGTYYLAPIYWKIVIEPPKQVHKVTIS